MHAWHAPSISLNPEFNDFKIKYGNELMILDVFSSVTNTLYYTRLLVKKSEYLVIGAKMILSSQDFHKTSKSFGNRPDQPAYPAKVLPPSPLLDKKAFNCLNRRPDCCLKFKAVVTKLSDA